MKWLQSELLTGFLARMIMKIAVAVGAGATVTSEDKATQIAAAVLTIVAFIVELVQSRIATKRALMTPPPVDSGLAVPPSPPNTYTPILLAGLLLMTVGCATTQQEQPQRQDQRSDTINVGGVTVPLTFNLAKPGDAGADGDKADAKGTSGTASTSVAVGSGNSITVTVDVSVQGATEQTAGSQSASGQDAAPTNSPNVNPTVSVTPIP